jgi:transposase/DNA-directed RNA polymerase specialized sigma24 family protein
MMIKNGDPIAAPDGTWCVWGEGLPLLWGSSQQTVLSAVSLRLGSHTQAVEEMARGARRWTQLATQAPAVHRMLSKKLKPINCEPAVSAELALIPERAPVAPQLTARQLRYQAALANEAKRDARRAEVAEQGRRERRAAALAMADEGKDLREISAELGINPSAVSQLIPGATKTAQLRTGPKPKAPSAEERVKAIATADTTPEHVAEQARVALRFAQNVMLKMGVWVSPAQARMAEEDALPKVPRPPSAPPKTKARRMDADRLALYQRAVDLIQSGHTTAQVAKMCGWTRASHVSKVLAKMGVPMPRRVLATPEQIIAAYDEHATVQTVAKKLHVHQRRVTAVLREAGKLRVRGQRRPESNLGGRSAILDDATIKDLASRWRDDGVSIREIAEEYGVSRPTVSTYLASAGVKVSDTQAEQRQQWREQAVALYQQGHTLQQVAEQIGGTATRVHNALRALGLDAKTARPQSSKPSRGRKPKLSDAVSAQIVARHARGESVESLARAYGCSLSTAYDRVRRAKWSGALALQGRQA